MGCGDSKLAVATSNAILRRKKSNAGEATKKSKDIGTIPGTTTDCDNSVAISKGQQQQQKAAEFVIKDNVGVGVADDVKDINENKKEDGGDKEIIAKGDNKEHEAGRLITSEESPRDFFSSRKLDDEGIDGIISEGRSGTSDYYTPRHGPGSKGNLFFKVDDQESKVVEEDKELLPAAEETKPAVDTTSSKENTGEAAVIVEEKLGKETAEVEIKTTTAEAKVSSPAASSLAADQEDKKEVEKEEKKEEKKEDKKEEKKEDKKEEKSLCECIST